MLKVLFWVCAQQTVCWEWSRCETCSQDVVRQSAAFIPQRQPCLESWHINAIAFVVCVTVKSEYYSVVSTFVCAGGPQRQLHHADASRHAGHHTASMHGLGRLQWSSTKDGKYLRVL